MSVIAELLRLVRQVLGYSWHARRPLLPVLVLVVGLAALVAVVLGVAAPVAIYPLL